MAPRLYNLNKLRRTIGELDPNDEATTRRLRESGEYSQSTFTTEMSNIGVREDVKNPLLNPTEIVFELVNFGAVAYFYYLENGQDGGLEIYDKKIAT